MENSDSDNLSYHSLNNNEIDDDSFIIDLSSDFPRLKTLDLNPYNYYTSTSFEKIFKDSNDINNSLNTLHMNIRGLETHFNDFVTYVSTFPLHFDVICLTEAHLYNKKNYLDTDRFDLEGYTSFKVHSSIRYGGCVVYVRNTLQCNMITELSGTNHVSDYLYVNVNVPGSRKKLCVAVYYRHNKHDKETVCNFTKQIDTQLNSPLLKNTHVILMGDMNIDLSKLSVNDAIEIYYNTVLCHNLESHINSPTRIQYNKNTKTISSATIIDHIFSNLIEFSCTSGNLAYADSDHFANFLTVLDYKKKRKKHKDSPIFKRNYTNINLDQLLSDFENIDWGAKVLDNSISLNEAVSHMIHLLNDLCDKHAPLTKVPKRKINYVFKPRITKDILPHIIAKNKMAANRHKNPEQFKKMRNHVNNIINKSKNSYFKKYFSEHSKNAKKVWEGIRCAIEWKRSNSNSIASITDNYGQTVTDPASIAQAFANYFKEIPQKSVSKIHKGSTKTDYTIMIKSTDRK